MEINQALAFAAVNDRTVLATRRRDGSLQMSPVNAGVVDGKVMISSRNGLAKVANLRRDPTASVLMFTDAFYGSWVQIDGKAVVVDQPEALDLLDRVYRAIAGEHPDWADYRRAMIADARVVLSITAERVSGQLG